MDHLLERAAGYPLLAHVLLFLLSSRRAVLQCCRQEHVAPLAAHPVGDVEPRQMLQTPGAQAGLLLKFAAGKLCRVAVLALREVALWEFPEPAAICGDDEGEVRLVEHPVDSVRTIGAADLVLADGHPRVAVDRARCKLLDHRHRT